MPKSSKENTLRDRSITLDSLQRSQTYVKSFPYVLCNAFNDRELELLGLGTVSGLSGEILHELRNARIDDYERILHYDRDPAIKKLVNAKLATLVNNGYQIKTVQLDSRKNLSKESSELEALTKKLENVHLCWSLSSETGKDYLLGHLRDVQRGGSVLAFVEKDGSEKAFSRLFLLNDDNGIRELFVDTAEGENYTNEMSDEEFAMLVYGLISIGNEMDCSRIYTPDDLLIDAVVKKLAGLGRNPFKRKRGKKIGIQNSRINKSKLRFWGEKEVKPYFWQLGRTRLVQPYLPLYQLDMEEILEKANRLAEKLRSFRRVGKKTRKKMETIKKGIAMRTKILQIQHNRMEKNIKTLNQVSKNLDS